MTLEQAKNILLAQLFEHGAARPVAVQCDLCEDRVTGALWVYYDPRSDASLEAYFDVGDAGSFDPGRCARYIGDGLTGDPTRMN